MSISFANQNPINADTDILSDFYDINKMDTRKDGEAINKILSKYGYKDTTDNDELFKNVLNFKNRINADESLTWRRVKLMDIGTLRDVETLVDKKFENAVDVASDPEKLGKRIELEARKNTGLQLFANLDESFEDISPEKKEEFRKVAPKPPGNNFPDDVNTWLEK
jgi:hypothetical protein